ncbi:MAG: diguanylate cyclase [Desulfobulbaceae bacterium]|jgi:diguanylate cyclase (GGDEF)-like protein|nr:diguanylate cyclase [Desulfobulbaceae bacterium]
MLKKLKLQSVNLLVLSILASTGVVLVLTLAYTVQQINQVEDDWNRYQVIRSDKARLESVLRSSIGYGGMIHNFKNFILRQDSQFMDSALANIGAARAALAQYSVLSLGEAEKVALEDIAETVNEYDRVLIHARDIMHSGDFSPEDVDQQVQVDDARALRGLTTLRSEVMRGAEYKSLTSLVKGRIAADIRAHLGYGAMIHDFKNLVLRRDLTRVELVDYDLTKIKEAIVSYRNLTPSVAETIALEDIEKVLLQYQMQLPVINKLIGEGKSAADIDQAVRVDDTLALRGLTTLDREVAHQVQALSRGVGEKLRFVVLVSSWLSGLMSAIILLVFVYSAWLFNRHVIQPVTAMTNRMELLAQGDTNIELDDVDLNNEIGKMARALATFREYIIFKQKAVEAAHHLASTDGLTGLDNRKRFEERLNETIKMAKRTGTSVACLMIDLDKFKAVNDTYGHGAGDEVLKAVAERLQSVSRETEFPARLGGDEFAVLLTAVDELHLAEIPAKRIIDQLKLPIYFEDKTFEIGCSIGVAGFPGDAENPVQLIKHADRALYAAKDAGRGTFCFFNPKMLDINEK